MGIIKRLVVGIRRIGLRIMMSTSPSEEVAGVMVVDAVDDGESPPYMRLLAEAVLLVAEHDAEAHNMIVEQFRAIYLTDHPRVGYQPATGGYFVGRIIVQEHAGGRLATSLVHGAMQASLLEKGMAYDTYEERADLERRCVERAARFASLLPDVNDAEGVMDYARAASDRSLWPQDAVELGDVEILASRGIPRFFARMWTRLSRLE